MDMARTLQPQLLHTCYDLRSVSVSQVQRKNSRSFAVHEISIAEALAGQVRRHIPAGHRACAVRVEAGPLQNIDPEAIAVAWQVVTTDTDLAGAVLNYSALPWQITCNACGRKWTGTDPFELCTCGSTNTLPTGSSGLCLLSLEVEPLAPA